jgi:EmrB/QacA subfamily drug resistance transporter
MTKPDARRWPMLVPLIVACALFMENLDSTIIATALPDMAATFGTSPVRLNIAMTAYMLALAIFIPVSGWIADRFGGRTVFRAAIATFTIASILCGLSNSVLELTAARILQGIGGAMMVPVGRLVLLRAVPKSELVRSMAWLTVPALIGPICGPPLGGFITTYASWRFIFLLNIPIGLLGMVLVTLFIANDKEAERPPLDWIGFLITGAAIGLILYGLDSFTHERADWQLVAALLVSGTCFALWSVAHALRHPHPLLALTLFRIPTFAANCDGGTLFRLASSALPFLLPLLLQVGFGMTAFASGMLTFAQAVGAMPMKLIARPLLRRYGFRTVLSLNAVVSAASIAACALLTPGTPVIAILILIFFTGFFRSLQFASLQALAYADIPPERMSASTSLGAMLQYVANGLGIAIAAIVLQGSLAWRGAPALEATDFRVAFVAIAAIAAASTLLYLRLAPDAGSEVSGRRAVPRPAPAAGD